MKKYILSTLVITLATSISFAQSFVYLKNNSGLLVGTVVYESSFLNSVKLNSFCVIKKITEGVNCEYLSDSNPFAKIPEKSVKLVNPNQNISPEQILKLNADLSDVTKKLNYLTKPSAPTSNSNRNAISDAAVPAVIENSPNISITTGSNLPSSDSKPSAPSVPFSPQYNGYAGQGGNGQQQIIYQVIEKAVPGPQGPQGPAGKDGLSSSAGSVVSQFFPSISQGSQFLGYGAGTDFKSNVDPTANARFKSLDLGTNLTVPNATISNLTALYMNIASSSIATVNSAEAIIVSSTITNATSSNFYALNSSATNQSAVNLTASNSSFGSTTIANATITNMYFTDGSSTNSTSTNLFSNNFSSLLSTIVNAVVGSATITNATSSIFNVSSLLSALNTSFTNMFAATGYTTNSYASTTNATTSNAVTTNTTNLNSTNSTNTNSTSTNLFTTNASVTNQTSVNLTANNSNFGASTITNATITNFFYTNGSSTNSTSTNLYAVNSSTSNATTTNSFSVNANANNLTSNNSTLTSATSTNFFATLLNAITSTITNLTSTNATLTNSTSTSLFSTNASVTNATTTNLFSALLTALSASFTSLFASNANFTNATATNLAVSGTFSAPGISGSAITATNATFSNATSSNFATGNLIATGTAKIGSLDGWIYGTNGILNGSSSPTVGYITATSGTSTFLGINAAGSIVPTQDSVYDLGSPTKRFKSLYVSSSTIYIDGTALSNNSGLLTWAGSGIQAFSGTSTLGETLLSSATVTNSLAVTAFTNLGGLVFASTSGRLAQTNALAYNQASNVLTMSGGINANATSSFNVIDMNSSKIINLAFPTNNNDAVNKSYVDAAFASGVLWQKPVKTISTTTAPVTPTTGDRYLLLAGQSGFGSCTNDNIAEWSGAAWVCTTAATGTTVFVDNGTDEPYNYNGSSWNSISSAVNHEALVNLQGGTTGQHYHLNLTQYNALNSGFAQLSALQTVGNPTFNSLSISQGLSMATATLGNASGTNLYISGTGNIANLIATGSSTIGSTTATNLTVTTNLAANNLTASNATLTNLYLSGSIQSALTNGYIFRGGSTNYSEATSSLFLADNGNIGIGTTTPGSILSIGTTNGINFTTGTTSFASTGGINLTSGCFAIAGTCLTTSLPTATNTIQLYNSSVASTQDTTSTSYNYVSNGNSSLNYSRPYGAATFGNYMYVSSNGDSHVVIYDISNPTLPSQVGEFDTTCTISDMAVFGTALYITDYTTNQMFTYNLGSNALAPTLADTDTTGTYPIGIVAGNNGYLYVANNDANGTISIFNISSPLAPVLSTTYTLPSINPTALAVSGTNLYVAHYNQAIVRVLNISSPTLPTNVTTVPVGTNPMGIKVFNNVMLVSNFTSNTINQFNITTPSAPVASSLASFSAGGTNPAGMTLSADGTTVYVMNNGSNNFTTFSVNTTSNTPVGGVGSVVSSAATTTYQLSNVLYIKPSLTNGSFKVPGTTASQNYDALIVNGVVRARGYTVDYSADLAETFPTSEGNIPSGTIVAFSDKKVLWNTTSGLKTATSTSDTYLINEVKVASGTDEAVGVISTSPGFLLGGKEGVPVAFSGRIPVLVTSENGVIKSGDKLALSVTIPGKAMKLTTDGNAIGVAMSDDNGTGKVLMLVQNGYSKANSRKDMVLKMKNGTTTTNIPDSSLDLVFSQSVQDLITRVENMVNEIVTHILQTDILCVGKYCVNEEQFGKIMTNSGLTPGNEALLNYQAAQQQNSNSQNANSSSGDSTTTTSTTTNSIMSTDTSSWVNSTSTIPSNISTSTNASTTQN